MSPTAATEIHALFADHGHRRHDDPDHGGRHDDDDHRRHDDHESVDDRTHDHRRLTPGT